MSVETDLQKILDADVSAYMAADRARQNAGFALEREQAAAEAVVQPAHARLRAAVTNALKPHRVEWLHHSPLQLRWDSGTAIATFDAEIWPRPQAQGKYSLHARPHIRLHMSPRDADEFRRIVAMVKAMADAATQGGL